MDWVHTYALVADQSACWVCTELPLRRLASFHGTSLLLLSQIGLGFRTSGTANIPCGMLPGLTSILGPPKPLNSYSVWDGSGWLRVEAVELAEPAPLCIENSKGQAQVGWTLDRSVSDPYSWTLLGSTEWCVPTGTL